MENVFYKRVRDYLKTFPIDFTVEQVVGNMEKAESEFQESQKKLKALLKEEYVGNAYFYEEMDDGEIVCKYIAYVKKVVSLGEKNLSLLCDIISINENQICYDEGVSIDEKSLKRGKKTSRQIFEIAKEQFDKLKAFGI
jgi:hypothetical protein